MVAAETTGPLPGDRWLQAHAALEQLGRDTVEATVWSMSEAEALLSGAQPAFSPQERRSNKAGCWLELEQRFGYGLDDLARRFDRSVSWVSRRLALVELLPGSVQQQVRRERSRRKWP